MKLTVNCFSFNPFFLLLDDFHVKPQANAGSQNHNPIKKMRHREQCFGESNSDTQLKLLGKTLINKH